MKRVPWIMAAIGTLMVFPLSAKAITLNWGDGESITVDTDSIQGVEGVGGVPEDVITIILEHQTEIENALTQNGVTSADAEAAVAQAKSAYEDFMKGSSIKTTAPYTTAKNGLNDFSDVMVDVLPNTQIQQNVWANAWIGKIFPKPRFGFGINTGVSKLDITPLLSTADALGVDTGDIPDTLVWPTITADVRLGGFILPFDVGFTVMSFDSNTIGALGDAIDPVTFDFFMIGGDVRYAILKGGNLRPKVSAGLGVYHTSGSFAIDDDDAGAGLDFSSTSIVLNAQASIKLLFFVPFVGARLMFSSTTVDWSARANWANILDTSNDYIAQALAYGILPSTFSGGSESGFSDHVRPVLFAGFAFDLAVIDLTFSASYDFVSDIPSAAFSLRFALN